MEQRQKYILAFQITFFLGYVFRILISGWYLVLFFIPEYLFRSFYYFSGTTLLDNKIDPKIMRLYVGLQIFYLLTSFFTYDGGDGSSYTFAGLWVNPPKTILLLCALFAFITIILIFMSINYHLKQNNNKFNIQNASFKFLVGCILIPGLAMFTASSLHDLKLMH